METKSPLTPILQRLLEGHTVFVGLQRGVIGHLNAHRGRYDSVPELGLGWFLADAVALLKIAVIDICKVRVNRLFTVTCKTRLQ